LELLTRGRGTAIAKSGKPSPTGTGPPSYLLDKDGYLRYGHFGEGGYGECEQVDSGMIHEVDPCIATS